MVVLLVAHSLEQLVQVQLLQTQSHPTDQTQI